MHAPPQAAGTYVIERLREPGHVHYGEEVFLRCSRGMHLGVGQRRRICAMKSERYAPAQRFVVEMASGSEKGATRPIPWGAKVRLRQQLANGYVKIRGDEAYLDEVSPR